VHKHIESAEQFDGSGDAGLDGGPCGHIGDDADGFSTALADGLCDWFAGFGSSGSNDHCSAFTGETYSVAVDDSSSRFLLVATLGRLGLRRYVLDVKGAY
jgi:hypothetical protein